MNTETLKSSVAERLDDLRDSLSRAQDQLGDLYDGARKKVVAGARNTDRAIRARPYQSIGIAVAVGILLGAFISRRRD
ncbi:MAG TPA: hypothetical protein VHD62_09870 [Opitutaceae bacterium]|nr:hypothetical protein [Opitutaceae bacterium]